MPSTVLVTGAAGALAAPTLRVFREAGYTLALIVHREADVADLQAAHPGAHVVAADLTDAHAAHTAVAALAEKAGRIDVLLNLAGGFGMAAAEAATPADFDRMFSLNMATAFNTTRATIPVMRAQETGFILGVAAAAADEGGAGMALYAASKAALVAYLKSLRAELAADGIRVGLLYPMGAIDTPSNRAAMPDAAPASLIDPVQLAEAMLFLTTRTDRGAVHALRVYPASRA